jgi:hypothetical protein
MVHAAREQAREAICIRAATDSVLASPTIAFVDINVTAAMQSRS